ncbi:hypothetical protein ABEF95_010617 [Exophiala dermatitidis]
MTPHSSNQSPSVGQPTPPAGSSTTNAATTTTAIDSDSDNSPEERPTHTSEIGTLKKLANQGTAWLGSSSGVYFVNTVRRAFSAAFASSHLDGPNAVPASEDILTGEDAEGRSYNGPIHDGPSTTDQFPQLLASALGKPPPKKIAMELVMSFFTAWHPLFPFLHGPTFLKDMESIYAREARSSAAMKDNPGTVELSKLVTFQLIINVASLDRTDIHLPMDSRIKTTVDVSRVAACLALSHDLSTIQAILAAELYLCATLAIRQASSVAGIMIKLIYHAGLHRCPLRYAQLSSEECEIRKRIFWSAYALDRHCNLSLGDPNIIQDDDIDVCLYGPELHKAVPTRDMITNPNWGMHMPPPPVPSEDPRLAESDDNGPEARDKRLREAVLAAYVQWAKLTGQIIEIFHKSINHRFPKHQQILRLTNDIETWWNNLPGFLTGESDIADFHRNVHDSATGEFQSGNGNSNSPPTDATVPPPPQQNLASFFKILYHRLLLLVNRPRLSLDQSTPEFQHGLQLCIRASRGIVTGLRAHRAAGQSMFLPGLLSAVWMSGLIIAFACQLGKYAKARALNDMKSCLSLLESMNIRWYTVQNCHKVLGLLLANIQSRKANSSGFLTVPKPEQQSQSQAPHVTTNDSDQLSQSQQPSRKRRRTTGGVEDINTTSPRKSSFSGSPNQHHPGATLPPSSTAGGAAATSTTGTSTALSAAAPTSSSRTSKTPTRTRSSMLSPAGMPSWVSLSSNYDPTPPHHPNFIHSSNTSQRNNSRPGAAASNDFSPSTFDFYADTSAWDRGQQSSAANNATQLHFGAPALGSAVYATPQDLAFAQSTMNMNMNMALPGFLSSGGGQQSSSSNNLGATTGSGNGNNNNVGDGTGTGSGAGSGNNNNSNHDLQDQYSDPMFWGNMDYNVADIFGSATWENMTGPFAPGGAGVNGGGWEF